MPDNRTGNATSINLYRLILGLMLLGAIGWLIYWRFYGATAADAHNSEMIQHFAAHKAAVEAAQPRAWREVARAPLLSQTLEVGAWYALPFTTRDPGPNLARTMRGRFASSDPRVELVLMDRENYDRLRAGYPPLILYNAKPSEAVDREITEGDYALVFMRPNEDPGLIPLSVAQALLYLMRNVQAANRPPARVTLELEQILECNCTPAETAQLTQRLAK